MPEQGTGVGVGPAALPETPKQQTPSQRLDEIEAKLQAMEKQVFKIEVIVENLQKKRETQLEALINVLKEAAKQ